MRAGNLEIIQNPPLIRSDIIRACLDAWARDRALTRHDHLSVSNRLGDLRRWLLANHHHSISLNNCYRRTGLGRSPLAELFTHYASLSIGARMITPRSADTARRLHRYRKPNGGPCPQPARSPGRRRRCFPPPAPGLELRRQGRWRAHRDEGAGRTHALPARRCGDHGSRIS